MIDHYPGGLRSFRGEILTQAESPRRSTIHQVARLAGVSHQTVSRYLRQDGGMKPETRKKIDSAVQALDYRPNLLARSMRTRRTNRLAVVLPSAHNFPHRLLHAAITTAHGAGYQLEIVSIEGGPKERAERVDELADSGQVEGILSLASLNAPRANGGQVPLVVTGDYDDEMHGLGELADGSAVSEIIEYLAALGHRTFLHVAGPATFASARSRKAVYLGTIARLGLRSYGVTDSGWLPQGGYDAIVSLPSNCGVTAVIAANDALAMGAIRGALSRGWQVPRDLSVFGWDDDEIARFATPSMSTVAVDRETQGREAMLRLVAAVRGEPAPQTPARTINTIVVRESTGPPAPDEVNRQDRSP